MAVFKNKPVLFSGLVVMCILFLALLFMLSAPLAPLAAAAQEPELTVTKTTVDAHEPFTITGSGFPANTAVYLAVYAPGVDYWSTDYFTLYRAGGGQDADKYSDTKTNPPFNAPVYGVKVTTDNSGCFAVDVALADRGSHGVGSYYGTPVNLAELPKNYRIYYRICGEDSYRDSGQQVSINRGWSFLSKQDGMTSYGFSPEREALIGAPGGKLVVAGAGFPQDASIMFKLSSPYPLGSTNNQNEYFLGIAGMDQAGSFEAELTLPEDLYHSTGYVRFKAELAHGAILEESIDLPLHIVRINLLDQNKQPTGAVVPGAVHYLDGAGFTPGGKIEMAVLFGYQGTSPPDIQYISDLQGKTLTENAGSFFYQWTAPEALGSYSRVSLHLCDDHGIWAAREFAVGSGGAPPGLPELQLLSPSLSANPDTAGAAAEWTVGFTPSVSRAVYAGEYLELEGPVSPAGGPEVVSATGLGDGVSVAASVYQGPARLRLTFTGGNMVVGQRVEIRAKSLLNPSSAGTASYTLRYCSPDGSVLASAAVSLTVTAPRVTVAFVDQPPDRVVRGAPFSVTVAVYQEDGSPAGSGRVQLRLYKGSAYYSGALANAEAEVQNGLALFQGVIVDSPFSSLEGDGCYLKAVYYRDTQEIASASSNQFTLIGGDTSRLLATSDSGLAQAAMWPGKLPGCDPNTGEGLGSLPPGEFALVDFNVDIDSGSWELWVEGGPLDGEIRLAGRNLSTGEEMSEVAVSGRALPSKLVALGPGFYRFTLSLASDHNTYGVGDLFLVLRGSGQARIENSWPRRFLREKPAQVKVNTPFRLVLCTPGADGSTARITLGYGGTPYETELRDSLAVFENVTVPFSLPDQWSRNSSVDRVPIYFGYSYLGGLQVLQTHAFRLVGHNRADAWNSAVGSSSPARVPQPGEGTLIKQGRYAVFDWSFTATEGSSLTLAGDALGRVPFTAKHGWSLELRRQVEGGGMEVRTVTSETYAPAGQEDQWLVKLDFGGSGLPPGSYGARLCFLSGGEGYGASEVYLLGEGLQFGGWQGFPRAVISAAEFPPLELDLPSVVEVPVGGVAFFTVGIKITAFGFSDFTIHYSIDPRALEIVRVEPPAGSGNRVSWISGQEGWVGVWAPQGTQFRSGSPLFTLVVKVKQPGDWVLSFLGNSWNANPNTNFLEWYKGVGTAVTIRGVAPSAYTGPPQVLQPVIDPETGEAVIAITGSGLEGAAKAVLSDAGGTILEVPASPSEGTLVQVRGRIPAGLYDVRLVDAAGQVLAALPRQAVPPAVPLMYVERVDRSPQVPGRWSTHIWRVRNYGTADGTAVISFLFPGFYDQPRPILPEGARLIWSGQKVEPFGWLAYVAVPVRAGAEVNVAWSLRLPPENVRFWGANPGAPVEVGDRIKLDASIVGAFSRGRWEELRGAADTELIEAAEDLGGVTESLSPLFALSGQDLRTYFQQLGVVYGEMCRRLYYAKELGLWAILQTAEGKE